MSLLNEKNLIRFALPYLYLSNGEKKMPELDHSEEGLEKHSHALILRE